MNQLLVLVLSMLLAMPTCTAQRKITGGLQAKLGLATYRPIEVGNTIQQLTAAGASLYANVPINAHLAFRPQLGWLQKGFQQTTTLAAGTGAQLPNVVNSKFTYTYLPLDLILVLRIRPTKVVKPYLQGGVRGSLLLNNQLKRTTSTQVIAGTFDLDSYHRLTMGLLLGAGLEWKRLALGVEVNRDLTPFLRVPPLAWLADLKPKFGWYGLCLHYQLGNF